ncbi:hypothetical protein CPB86DRAFT_597981 [Serendipita vermifera]|nr:hypothetical protein CPB86DRAFT_597981 [Serendipita vermifera]
MTPSPRFHPSFRDDLTTVPSEEEEALATASTPMEIITHDVNRLLQYLDGVDRQRMAEHNDVKAQLDRVEGGLQKVGFRPARGCQTACPDTCHSLFRCSAQLDVTAPAEGVVMHGALKPSVVLLDIPESFPRLSSGSVTESVAWLSKPSNISQDLPVPHGSIAGSREPSELTRSPSLLPSGSAARSESIHPSESLPLFPSIHPSDSASQVPSMHSPEKIALSTSAWSLSRPGSTHPSEPVALTVSERPLSTLAPSITQNR